MIQSTRRRKKEKASKSRVLTKLRAGLAAFAIAASGCTLEVSGLRTDMDPGRDIPDAAVVDARPDSSARDSGEGGGPVLDGGDGGTVLDSGTDAGPLPDSGIADGGDGGVVADSGSDAGTVCTGVTKGQLISQTVNTGAFVKVGGYKIINLGEASTGVNIELRCGATDALIKTNVFCDSGGPEGVVSVPADGFKVRVLNHGDNSAFANLTINVDFL